MLIYDRNSKGKPIVKPLLINEQIRVPIVLLIDETGASIGQISRNEALSIAEERGYDLVEVSPQVTPPVCKLLDYGKLKYEETRAERKARANQKTIDIKEIRIGVKISEHDLLLKINQAKKFIEKGNKVRVSVKMKGREQAFPDKAYALIEQIISQTDSKPEQSPSRAGNQISVTIN